MATHDLSGGRTITTPDGIEDLMMALKGFLFPFLCLEVPLPRFSDKIKKREKKTLQDPVLRHSRQKAMKIGIPLNRV